MATQPVARLTMDGDSIELPIVGGSMGPRAVDVRQLFARTGRFTYDPGFMSTAACECGIHLRCPAGPTAAGPGNTPQRDAGARRNRALRGGTLFVFVTCRGYTVRRETAKRPQRIYRSFFG